MAAQVFVEDPSAPELGAEQRHHLQRVLRLTKGEFVVAADGAGRSTLCQFTGTGPLIEPTAPVTSTPRPIPPITIAFTPVKGDRPEWTVQKLTELGVDRIVPLLSDRSIVRWEGQRTGRATERLRRVAREAAAQSRRSWLPIIGEPITLGQLVTGDGGSVALAERDGGPPSLRHAVVAVGPEGGWSEGERSLGLPQVSLGDATLRAETAALAAGTLLTALRASLVAALSAVS